MQVRAGELDVQVLVLADSGLGGQHGAAVDLPEVAVRERVPLLRLRAVVVVDAEEPLLVLAPPVFGDEVVLLLG